VISPGTAAADAARGIAVRRTLPLVLVAGNPNSGKSTLFNALTGANAKVSNYPGVTVSRTSATMSVPDVGHVELVDMPGTYSLSARSRDEQVAVDAVLGRTSRPPDALLVVADATALARSLYFAYEVIATGAPVVVVLNMMDEARSQGIVIDIDRLRKALGVEVVPVVARRQQGIGEIGIALARAIRRVPLAAPASFELPEPTESDVRDLTRDVAEAMPSLAPAAQRAWAIWLLLSLEDELHDDLEGVPVSLRAAATRVSRRAASQGRNLDQEIIAGRYAHVDATFSGAVRSATSDEPSWTDRIDAVLTHRLWGFVVFAIVMLVLFQALFTWSEPVIKVIELGVASLQDAVTRTMPAGPLRDLVVDGVIAGVGNVIVFVPQIGLLFLFIATMEDAGYLARVAFVIDRVMGRIGLHGKSFVPMLSGFSCAIPAVLATRTLENRTDRLLTMMVLPLVSCSARLPVYILVIATVFGGAGRVFGFMSAGALTLFAMYVLSITAALTAAAVLRRTVFRGPRPTLLLELPPYRRPVARVLLATTWHQVRSFLVDAGTIILALTIILWALLNYPRDREAAARVSVERATIEASIPAAGRPAALETLSARARGDQLRHSIAGRVGHIIEPVLTPLGFDWRIGIGILGAFAAREVFVSTMGIVFDIGNADEQTQPLRDALRQATRTDGSRLMTPLTGLALMVFFVLACQCMSTLAVVHRESGSWRWPALMFGYQSLLAYVCALIVYQGGRLLGFS
jgi:ferrous iron transport protein B